VSDITATAGRQLLQQLTAIAVRLFKAAACSIALLDGDELEYVAATGAGADRIVGTRLPITRGIAGWAAASGQPVVISDVRRDPRFARDVAESTGYVPTAIVAAPLQTEQGVHGVLSILDPAVTDVMSDRLLELASVLAAAGAVAVEADAAARRSDGEGTRGDLIALIRRLGDEEVEAVWQMAQAVVRLGGR
jgi:GAF domain-containing protein